MAAVFSEGAPHAAQRGLMMVETLVAIAVFSVGVLGAVTLQGQAMRHLGDAHYRAEASHLTQALVARMWADDPAVLVDRYDMARSGAGYRDFVDRAKALPGAALPGNAPDVRVTPGPSAASRTVTIALRWQLPGESSMHQFAGAAVIGRN